MEKFRIKKIAQRNAESAHTDKVVDVIVEVQSNDAQKELEKETR